MTHRSASAPNAEYDLPAPIWPQTVTSPGRPPCLVYLDLNHWIELTKVRRGTGSDSYANLFSALVKERADGRIAIVLSGPLFREVSKIKDPAKRAALAAVMDDLTGFRYLLGLTTLWTLELNSSLDALTGALGPSFGAVSLVGNSMLHTLGMKGGLRIVDKIGSDVTREFATRTEAERALPRLEHEAELLLLRGPSNEDLPALRAAGWRPEIPQQTIQDNASFEAAWSERLQLWRSTRVTRDILIGRHLCLELIDALIVVLAARGLSIENVATPERARQLVMSMPSSAVMVSLLAQYHQNAEKRWTQNDIYDMDALASAVPYCDIVFTDAAARDALLRRHLSEHFDTAIPRRPEHLVDLLAELARGPT